MGEGRNGEIKEVKKGKRMSGRNTKDNEGGKEEVREK